MQHGILFKALFKAALLGTWRADKFPCPEYNAGIKKAARKEAFRAAR